MSGATIEFIAYSLPAFRLPLHRSRFGKRQQKKPAPQSYLEVKALAVPETKIRKAVRALWARSASGLPCFVQICEILTFRQVVSLPIYAANIHIFHSCKEKMPLAPQKISTAFTATKVEDLTILMLVLFGTCLQKLCHVEW